MVALEFDDLLTKHIGPFGRFQAVCFVCYLLHVLPYFLAVQELIFQVSISIYDTCHEKIDPFRVQKRVLHELS